MTASAGSRPVAMTISPSRSRSRSCWRASKRCCAAAPHTTRLKVEDLEFDLLARRVTRGGREVELTARELKLLEFLMRRAGQVVTRTMLLEGVWDLHFDPQSNLIDVHISRLRQAIDRGSDRPLIHK